MPPGIYKRKPRPARPIEWLKECIKCEVMKTLNDYYPDPRKFDHVHSVCKECTKADRKQRYEEDPAKYNAQSSAYAADPINRQKMKAHRYGITFEELTTLIEKQNNSCAACFTSFEDIPDRNIHIDHDHECCPSNKGCRKCIRGILCWNCNAALGMLKDDIVRVHAIGKYLMTRQRAII